MHDSFCMQAQKLVQAAEYCQYNFLVTHKSGLVVNKWCNAQLSLNLDKGSAIFNSAEFQPTFQPEILTSWAHFWWCSRPRTRKVQLLLYSRVHRNSLLSSIRMHDRWFFFKRTINPWWWDFSWLWQNYQIHFKFKWTWNTFASLVNTAALLPLQQFDVMWEHCVVFFPSTFSFSFFLTDYSPTLKGHTDIWACKCCLKVFFLQLLS